MDDEPTSISCATTNKSEPDLISQLINNIQNSINEKILSSLSSTLNTLSINYFNQNNNFSQNNINASTINSKNFA